MPLVDAFCVSNLDEALEVRQVAGEKPILILGVAPVEHVAIAIKEEIRYTVASLEWLKALLAEKSDLTGLKVHIKVDSGMGRIGFRSAEDLQEAMILLRDHGAEVEGIFTHFATADEKDDRHFQGQLQRFKSLLELLPYTPKSFMPAIQQQLYGMLIPFLMLSDWAMSCMVSIQVERFWICLMT